MKICLCGDFSVNLDEGYKNISHSLADGLCVHNLITRINVKGLGKKDFWIAIGNSNPDIIHTISQPTCASLIFTKLLKLRWPNAQTVISSIRPERYFRNGSISLEQKLVFRLAHPDLVLVQSEEVEDKFKSLGCKTNYLSNGVDLNRFKPASQNYKHFLRQKYGIHASQPVALHVGHIEPARNLDALADLLTHNIQVVVVGSQYMGTDEKLIKRLSDFGFHIILGYQSNIEHFYMLADCYVFPVLPGDSISMPLSVLEAMACNLPIATTRFNGLVKTFSECRSFKYINQTDEIPGVVSELNKPGLTSETRDMVSSLSWESVTTQLTGYYDMVLEK